MRTTRQLSITLPNDMADALRERVDSGAYASKSEVIRDGLRTLLREAVAGTIRAVFRRNLSVLASPPLRCPAGPLPLGPLPLGPRQI